MIKINYHHSVPCPFSEKVLLKIATVASELEPKLAGVVEVGVVGDKEIKKLNQHYRGVDKITDVLSFSWSEDGERRTGKMLGQIYICYPQIVRQAKDFEVSAKEEFARMMAHGLLHIVGYDHIRPAEAKKMFSFQEKILKLSGYLK